MEQEDIFSINFQDGFNKYFPYLMEIRKRLMFIAAIFVLFVGISLIYESFFPFGSFLVEPQVNLAKETTAIFFIVLSSVLIILSAYLIFKFERRSGVIVYRR